jgi:FAD:protein FMN transferase
METFAGQSAFDLQVHSFSHKAMATEFGLWICHDEEEYASQAAWEAFLLLGRIEAELSRFDPNSDIARLNAAKPGEPILLGENAFTCLKQSLAVHAATQGAFDITAGIHKDFWMQRPALLLRVKRRLAGSLPPVGMYHLHLIEGEYAAWKDAPVIIDPGAIGKGFAVDRMGERLQEWGVTDFLIHGGASSVAARGCAPEKKGWPVILRHPISRHRILAQFDLLNGAMGASGLEKGLHIIDPRSKKPVCGAAAAWVIGPDAATADAFSTAFMVMRDDRVEACLLKMPELGALVVRSCGAGETILRHGMAEID